MSRIVIQGGRLIDPANQRDTLSDVYLADGHIVALEQSPAGFTPDRVIDAHGQIVCPGLIDLCARVREPGLEHKADIASEARAAAANGITTLVMPPDTDPVIDEPAVVELIRRRSEAASQARVYTLGALSQGLQGEKLAEMAALKEAGCVGMSNGLRPITNTLVLRRCLEYAATFDLTVFLNPVDPWLAANGCAHDGQVAARLGLNPIPVAAETTELARLLALIADVGVRAHIGRLSSAAGVTLIERAKADGLAVSADVSAHHTHLTEIDLERFDSRCHVLPPLREPRDKNALRTRLASGVIDALCSDHQPHEAGAREDTFSATAAGISGLDTLLSLGLKLVEEHVLDLSALITRLSWRPAQILKLSLGRLDVGAAADICIFDPTDYAQCSTASWYSRGHNSPFLGWELPGRVSYTLLAGQVVYERLPSGLTQNRDWRRL